MKTVAQLIEELQKYPPDFRVVMSSDPEGNHFHVLQDTDYGVWRQHRADNDYYGEFSSWTYDEDENERELTIDESNTVCLWP